MEPGHETEIHRRFPETSAGKNFRCFNIPDKYSFMDEELQYLIKQKMDILLKEYEII